MNKPSNVFVNKYGHVRLLVNVGGVRMFKNIIGVWQTREGQIVFVGQKDKI